MMSISGKELKWRWVYVEEPSMEPDERGRWMVKGYIEVQKGVIPGYDWVANLRMDIDTVPLVLVHIKRGNELVRDFEGYAFEVIMPHIMDLDNGLIDRFHASTFEEAQAKAQEVLHMLAKCLSYQAPESISSRAAE
jgi:hypothetical protein